MDFQENGKAGNSEERLKAIEVAILRGAKAKEEATKKEVASRSTSSASGESRESDPVATLKAAGQTAQNIAGAATGDSKDIAALVKQGFDLLANELKIGMANFQQATNDFNKARFDKPKDQVTEMADQMAQAGHQMGPEEINEMRRQVKEVELRRTISKQNVDVEFSGVGLGGRASEALGVGNVFKGIKRLGNSLGNINSYIDNYNTEHYDSINKDKTVTQQGFTEGE